MADLWAERRARALGAVEPLAVRMRPRTLDEVAGQGHILGPGKLLRRMLDADRLTSLIFYGPPGTGKTTLAEVIARHTDRHFERENAAGVGVAQIRKIIDAAQDRLENTGRRTILFLDEIHRFTRAQQDVLLADVERGVITLIGATTENPLFAVNSALVSRSTLFRLEPLTEDDIIGVLKRAIADPDRGFGKLDLTVDDDALRVWAVKSDGDARRALTALEVAVLSSGRVAEWQSGEVGEARALKPADDAGGTPAHSATPSLGRSATPPPLHISRADAEESIQQKAAVYDATGDEHYDAASAMIKSVRGSDPDAALYWMARMLEAGEDPRFIVRRLAILASEDIGNADPRAIMVAASAWHLVERLGMPEARITLAQCCTYLALAPKSNAAYVAIEEALEDVREGRTVQVPQAIKDKNVKKGERLSAGRPDRASGGGAGGSGGGGGADAYAYTHEEGIPSPLLGRVGQQSYLGIDRRYYRPTDHGSEKVLRARLDEARRLRAGDDPAPPPEPPPPPSDG
jgi:putative ATPase